MLRSLLHVFRSVFIALVPLVVFTWASPRLPDLKFVTAFSSFLIATLSVVMVAALAPRRDIVHLRVTAVTVVVGLCASLLATKLPSSVMGISGALGIFLVATTVGTHVGSRVESPGHILPVAMLSAAVDLWSVTSTSGPTHAIVQTPSLLRLLTVMVPIPPSREPEPMIGFGDVVFAALYLAITTRFGLSLRRSTSVLYVSMIIAGLTAAALEAPVPALPFMGLALVLAHPEARRVPSADRNITVGAGVLLALSVIRFAASLRHG
jgi:hypothetical protein